MGTIRTVQYTGTNCIEVLGFLGNLAAATCTEVATTDRPIVRTPKGQRALSAGDWVVRGVDGRFNVLSAQAPMAHTTSTPSMNPHPQSPAPSP